MSMLNEVYQCARCGQTHLEDERVEFKRFKKPVVDRDGTVWEYWGTCPLTGDPILLSVIQEPNYAE